MPEFLAETYTPRGGGTPALCSADIARAAGQASGPGAPVRFLGAINVPEEETCFYLYQAPTAGAVRAAMTAAGLRPERITHAAFIRPPAAPPQAGAPPGGRCTQTPAPPGPGRRDGPHRPPRRRGRPR